MSDHLKHKLHGYQVPPPPGAWKEIAGELAESNELLPLSKKMYDFEVTPPASAWKAIANSLGSSYEITGHLPEKRIPAHVNQIVAAAAIFGVLLMGSLYILYNNSSKKQLTGLAKNIINSDKKNKSIERSIPSTPDVAISNNKQSTTISAIASNYITHKEKKNSHKKNKSLRNTIVNIAHASETEPKIAIAAKPIRNEKGDIIQDMKLVNGGSNKYISITGPNGEQTKISSKFMNLLLYLNGDSDIEEFDGYFDKHFLESLIWKSRFEDWRTRIIQTSFIPSSINFMDILEFKDLITKDKERQ